MNNNDLESYNTNKYGAITTRPYQQYVIDKMIEHCKVSLEPAVVLASVGSGKTIMIAAMAKHVSEKGGKVLVLSRQGEIVEQDADDCWLAKCFNSLYSASLGKKSTTYPVILGTEGTVYNALLQDQRYQHGECDFPSDFADQKFDLLLIDECHMVDFETETSQYMVIINELRKRNPKMRIIGLTGTDYRGVKPIVGDHDYFFWKKRLCSIDTEYLTGMGYLVPCTFGFGDKSYSYDLDEFKSDGSDGTKDYTLSEMRAMEEKILQDGTTTQKIMLDVLEKTKNRNCVMVTCSGKKHCKEAAKFLPKGSYIIITDDLNPKDRYKKLKLAYEGSVKYIFQVAALSTGYNNPLIDVIVILRKIGSLTLLVQLIGRGLRLLKDFQIEQGIQKDDCLVLDYSETMSELKDLYDNPILEYADFEKHKDHGTVMCPRCNSENSRYAVRCVGTNGIDRCDFFFKSRICEDSYHNGALKQSGCGAENAPTARFCRECNNTLIDPNDKLSSKHYQANDYIPVNSFTMGPTKNNGVYIIFDLDNGDKVKLFFSPFSENKIGKTIWRNNFVKKAFPPEMHKSILSCKNAADICIYSHLLNRIQAVTHRINNKGQSIVSKFIFK